jgi:hypothetical protein
MSTTRPLRKTQAYELDDRLRYGRYAFAKLGGVIPQILQNASSLSALPTASQGEVTTIQHGSLGPPIEMYQTTAQTLQPVVGAGGGLVLDGDQVDNESAEFVIGGNSARNPLAMVVGTDPDFFFRARIGITDASGSDQLLVGWRKVETYQVPTSFLTTGDGGYADFFGVGFAATKANPNTVACASDVGNAGSTTVTQTGFTWADTKIHDLEVRVVGGKPRVLINGIRIGNPIAKDALGAAITSQNTVSTPSYTFTAGLTLVPFIFVRQDADLLDAVQLYEYEVGHLLNAGLDPQNEQ